jgi:hypothetical protein
LYSDFVVIDSGGEGVGSDAQRIERLAFGETAGRNEAWLRDTLLAHADLLPVRDIDPSYGPLIPVCRELPTDAGRIDAVFISPHGRLTLVECKLWRNPEARRKVVAQILDYARVVSHWTYSDLQRNVSKARGQPGNVLYDLARAVEPGIKEHQFVDQVSAALREGRFLLVIAGDGIQEDVGAMAELITRNAALGFSFGLVEVALFGMQDGRLLVQPRVVARTQIIERTVVVVRGDAQAATIEYEDAAAASASTSGGAAPSANELGESPKQAAYRRWWQPVIDAPLDDPDQEPPKLFWPNNVRLQLPWKQTWIGAYCYGGESGQIGVGTGGRSGADQEMLRQLESQMSEILAELPPGTEYRNSIISNGGMTIAILRNFAEFADDEARRAWVIQTINAFVNALRPRIKRLIRITPGESR